MHIIEFKRGRDKKKRKKRKKKANVDQLTKAPNPIRVGLTEANKGLLIGAGLTLAVNKAFKRKTTLGDLAIGGAVGYLSSGASGALNQAAYNDAVKNRKRKPLFNIQR